MNRIPTDTIIGLIFFSLATFSLIGTSIAEAIALIGHQGSTPASEWLIILSIIEIILGLWFLGFFKVVYNIVFGPYRLDNIPETQDEERS